MKRAVALLVAVLIALGAVWLLRQEGPDPGDAVCADIERVLSSQPPDVAGAKRLAAAAKERIRPRTSLYLDGLIALVEGRTDEAYETTEKALAADPEARDDWRVVSLAISTRLVTRRLDGCWKVIDDYVTRHPDDERGLMEAAAYWVQVRVEDPDPERAKGYLDRIAKLPARTVPDTDPTAVPASRIAAVRTRVEKLLEHRAAAVEAAQERVRLSPNDAQAHAVLGDALREAGKVPQAEEELRRAITLDAANLVYRTQLAKLLLDNDDAGTDVVPLAKGLFDADPTDPEAGILWARALVRDDRIAEAIDVYRGLLGEDQGLSRGQLLEVLNNLSAALYDFKGGGGGDLYRDEAYQLLIRYLELGGKFDSRMEPIWEKLQQRARDRGTAPR